MGLVQAAYCIWWTFMATLLVVIYLFTSKNTDANGAFLTLTIFVTVVNFALLVGGGYFRRPKPREAEGSPHP